MLNHSTSIDKVFQALADPTRRAIVDRLSQGPASVSEIARPLPLSLAAVVQQIQLLEECGVIRTRKSGRVRTCQVEPQALALVEDWLSTRRQLWMRRFDALGDILNEQARADGQEES